MKNYITYLTSVLFIATVCFFCSEPVTAQSNVNFDDTIIQSLEEWDVPWDETRSRDPYVAPDGTVYFAGQRAHYVGHFNPETGDFRNLPLEDGAGPHTVVVADDGTVWYAGNRARHIGKMDPETGEITKYMMDDDYARDPHTFAFDKDGNLWFTAQGGNGVGHFNVETGEARVIPVPTERARPYGIRMAPDGETPWIALFGTNKIATVNPETFELSEIELPRETIRARRLDVTSDGNVWYGDFASGYIGRYNPQTGEVTEWEMPDGEASRPYAVLKDHKDRIWFSASGLSPNKLVAFDTQSEQFVASKEIPTGEGSIRHMDYDERTQSLWFGTDTGHIGRIVIN
jgi:virginiamycin B lyase